ncbi:MAG TPA: hypothetical protein VLD62_12630 [Acidimicrobiia bacterium]|nr:hypothetical protein [Acidimicrobiia bacterium]
MTWMNAWARAALVFVYFVGMTVIVPDYVVGALGSASNFVRDAVVLVVWTVGFGAGLWGLRRLQSRGVI